MKQPNPTDPTDPKKNLAKRKASVRAATEGWNPAPLTPKTRKKAMKDRANAEKYGTIVGPTTSYQDADVKNAPQYTTTPIQSRRGNPYNINTYGSAGQYTYATPDLDKQAWRKTMGNSGRGRDPKFGPAPKRK